MILGNLEPNCPGQPAPTISWTRNNQQGLSVFGRVGGGALGAVGGMSLGARYRPPAIALSEDSISVRVVEPGRRPSQGALFAL